MDLTQIIEKNKVGFHSFGNDELYDCFYSLFDGNIQQFEASIEKNYGRKVLKGIIPGSFEYSINTDGFRLEILIEKNIDLLTSLVNKDPYINQYLSNVQKKLEFFKEFLQSPSHSRFLSGMGSYHKYYNQSLIEKLDEYLLKLKKISEPIPAPIIPAPNNNSIDSRSATYGSQLSSDFYLSVSDNEIPPPPPRPVSHYDCQLGGANSGTMQIPHWDDPLNYSYIGVPSSILSCPSATSITQYPSQPLSVSNPVYSQSHRAYAYQASPVSIPFYSQIQPEYSSQLSSVSIPVYSQSHRALPYRQEIIQPTWNGAYYSPQNQQIPCSLIPIVKYETPYSYPTYSPTSYPSSPFVSLAPSAPFSYMSSPSPFVSTLPAGVCVPTSCNSLQGMGRRR